jgi:hypothetical protein
MLVRAVYRSGKDARAFSVKCWKLNIINLFTAYLKFKNLDVVKRFVNPYAAFKIVSERA